MSVLDRFGKPLLGSLDISRSPPRGGGGGWIGGGFDRPGTEEWIPPLGSADTDNETSREVIIPRARGLWMNDPLIHGAVLTYVTSVVGTGPHLRATFKPEDVGMTRPACRALRRMAEKRFRRHASSQFIDYDMVDNIFGLTCIVVVGVVVAGDIFAIRRRREENPRSSMQVQLVEGDRVVNPVGVPNGGKSPTNQSNTITSGVEVNRKGQPVAYWISDYHPADPKFSSGQVRRVEAFNRSGRRRVLHIFQRRRPGQSRGVSMIAPIIQPAKIRGQYAEAKLFQAATQALFGVIIRSPTGQRIGSPASAGVGDDLPPIRKLRPGMVAYARPGEEVDMVSPTTDSGDPSSFERSAVRSEGAAMGLNYQTYVKEYLGSFSAARAAFLDAERSFVAFDQTMDDKFLFPVWEWFIEDQVLAGKLEMPGFFDDEDLRDAYCECVAQGDALGSIDELKQANASGRRIELGVSSEIVEARKYGHDYETLLEQAAEARELRDEFGLPEPSWSSNSVAPTVVEVSNPEELVNGE